MAKSKAMEKIRKAALAYPDTREDHPWGEMAWLDESFRAVAPKRVLARLGT